MQEVMPVRGGTIWIRDDVFHAGICCNFIMRQVKPK